MDEEELYDTMVEQMLEKMATFQFMGSGWRLRNVIQLELHTVRYNPLKGETQIPLPKVLKVKTAIIKMKNDDNRCFLWCVLRALNPKDHNSERVDTELKKQENTLNMKGIEYPLSLKDLDKFEKQNLSISVTVLGYDRKNGYPLRISEYTERKHSITLL